MKENKVNKEDIDLDALEQKARAATPGPWVSPWDDAANAGTPEGQECFRTGDGAPIVWATYWNGEKHLAVKEENAAFIASVSPDVVLALVARLRAAEGALEDIACRGLTEAAGMRDVARAALARRG